MQFGSLLLAAEKNKATFIAPVGIGLALFIAELLGVYYTGGSLNPVSAKSIERFVLKQNLTGMLFLACHDRHDRLAQMLY